MTATIEVTKVEEQALGRLLFNFRAQTEKGRIEFPIAIQNCGSPALDEAAVLDSAQEMAQELIASLRLRLTPQADTLPRTP